MPRYEWTPRFILSLGATLLGAVLGCAGDGFKQLEVLDLNGRQINPFGSADVPAIVFLFIGTDCPISNRYAPEIKRLSRRFAPNNIAFWLVYPNADETVPTIRQHIAEYNYELRVLRDPKHALVKMTGVGVTPEAVVFLPERRLVYRGRIDDRYVAFGKTRPAPTMHDLEQVLEAIIEGKPLSKRVTTAIGCFIPELR